MRENNEEPRFGNHKERNVFSRLLAAFRGYKTSEYALLVGAIAVIVIAFVTWLTIHMNNVYNVINNTVK